MPKYIKDKYYFTNKYIYIYIRIFGNFIISYTIIFFNIKLNIKFGLLYLLKIIIFIKLLHLIFIIYKLYSYANKIFFIIIHSNFILVKLFLINDRLKMLSNISYDMYSLSI